MFIVLTQCGKRNLHQKQRTSEKLDVYLKKIPFLQDNHYFVLAQQLKQAQLAAMKDRDAKKVAVLRMAVSAVKNAEIDAQKELDDAMVLTILKRQVKQLQDACNDFLAAGRQDLVEQSQYEIRVLEEYLPAQLSDMELDTIAKEVIAQVGATTHADVGKVMGSLMAQIGQQADGSRVRARVLSLLS